MPAATEKGRLNREIWGVIIGLSALLIALSLISYNPSDRSFNTPSGALNTHNWGGFVGAFLATCCFRASDWRPTSCRFSGHGRGTNVPHDS